MGKACSRFDDDSTHLNVNDRWRVKRFPDIPPKTFENHEEETIYKTLCLIRSDPHYMLPYIRDAKHNKHYTGANIGLAVELLKKMKPLPILQVSVQGNEACRKANDDMKDQTFLSCQRITKVYKDLFYKRSLADLATNQTIEQNPISPDQPVRRSLFSDIEGNLLTEQKTSKLFSTQVKTFDLTSDNKINGSHFLTTHENNENIENNNSMIKSIVGDKVTVAKMEEPVSEYTEIGWEGTP